MPNRNQLEELTEAECWELLARNSVGRIAIAIKNKPDIFPVNYRVDGETIVVRTAPGIKLAAATLGSGVAFEVDELDQAAHSGASVVVKGQAIEAETTNEMLKADALGVEPWAAGPKNRYFRLTPDELTGRRIPAVDPARSGAPQ